MSGILAPAKLTWSLHVTGVRGDGLHLLDAEMVSLDLADTVELTETTEETSVVVTAAYPAAPQDALVGDDDLVRRALRLVGRRAKAEVVKRIPIGAGLGGGSADAAAVLRWAGVTDPARAITLGSDVPFCMVGGRATVRGVGEIVEPLSPLARTVTLAMPAFRVDTAACYRAFDALGPKERLHPRNDLSRAAELVAPELADVRRVLEERTGADFVLAGSGSTLYCEGDPMGLGTGTGEVVETRSGPLRLLVARTRET